MFTCTTQGLLHQKASWADARSMVAFKLLQQSVAKDSCGETLSLLLKLQAGAGTDQETEVRPAQAEAQSSQPIAHCSVDPGCQNKPFGICCRCNEQCCARHGYADETDTVLACRPCGGPPPPHWASLRAEWETVNEQRVVGSDLSLNALESLGRTSAGHGFTDVCLVDSLI